MRLRSTRSAVSPRAKLRIAVLGTGAIGRVLVESLRPHAALPVGRTTSLEGVRSGSFDVALVAVKSGGTSWAAGIAKTLLKERGICITVQNGLGNLEILENHLGPERALQGLIYVGAEVRADGSLFRTGPGELVIGCESSMSTWAQVLVDGICDLLAGSGMQVRVVEDTKVAVWRKLVVNSAINPTSALFGLASDEILAHNRAALLADRLAAETAAVANRIGVELSTETATELWRTVAAATAGNRSSMLQDVLAGRATEVRALNGAVALTASSLGLAAPLNSAMVAIVEAIGGGKI